MSSNLDGRRTGSQENRPSNNVKIFSNFAFIKLFEVSPMSWQNGLIHPGKKGRGGEQRKTLHADPCITQYRIASVVIAESQTLMMIDFNTFYIHTRRY